MSSSIGWFTCGGLVAMAFAMSSRFAPFSPVPSITFDDMPAQQPPVGFTMGPTGAGGPVSWVVRADPTTSGCDIVRAKDEANYYVLRANALDENVRLCRVVDGRRTQIAAAISKFHPTHGTPRALVRSEAGSKSYSTVSVTSRHDLTFVVGQE